MNKIIAYYPILDMLLAFRQIYTSERFKPYVNAMEVLSGKISSQEKDMITDMGEKTDGWLGVMEKFIELSCIGMVSPEEMIVKITKQPEILVNSKIPHDITIGLAALIKTMWRNYFGSEAGRYGKSTLDKVLAISESIEEQGLMDFILNTSDRMEKCGEKALKVHIKPEHIIHIDKVQTAIVMPSVYASRRLTFWYNGNSYLFYVSLDTFSYDNIEPSDMLLLKTLAFNDRTRLKMLKLLAGRSYSTNEMADRLNMNASTVSRHFKVFKDAGFVDISSQEGNFIYYSLNLEEIRNSFKDMLNYIIYKE